MGFIGRYAREGDAKRAALIAALDTRLELLRPFVEEPFMIDPAAGPQLFNGLYRLVPWIIPLSCALLRSLSGLPEATPSTRSSRSLGLQRSTGDEI